MADSEPDFQVPVWKYTYAEGSGADTIFLHSPQEVEDQQHGTLVLRQINSDAENKVWIQDQASLHFKRCDQTDDDQDKDDQLMDDAHGVIARDGQAKAIVRQDEKPRVHNYKRGDRIWVERTLVPTYDIGKDENKIPVIDLESFVLFWVPFEYICFVPQFTKKDLSGEQHAASPSAVLNTFQGKRKTKARIYFHWPVKNPQDVSYMWLDKKNKDDLKTMRSFNTIQPLEARQKAFRRQWEALTKKLARSGLLLGDDVVEGDANRFESSSDTTDEELELHWEPGKTTLENCCNLNPCPSQNDPELDLVPSYVGGLRWIEHYHVQDDDLDECPQGAAHEKHCVLRDKGTRCAYDSDRVRHTCCKLRTNPILPGPYGDPDDFTLPLWETNAPDEYFVDVSRNVQTRRELEDRDNVPLQMHRLRQQMMGQAEAGQQRHPRHQIRQGKSPIKMADTSPMMGVSIQQPMQQPRQQQLSNDSVDVDMTMEAPEPYMSMMNPNGTVQLCTPSPEPHNHLAPMPDSLAPLPGTVIPMTIPPSAQTFDHTFNPVANLVISSALPMTNLSPADHIASMIDMSEWNPMTYDQYAFTPTDQSDFVPQAETSMSFSSTTSYPNYAPTPRKGHRRLNHPGD